jgi:hypothetical protein
VEIRNKHTAPHPRTLAKRPPGANSSVRNIPRQEPKKSGGKFFIVAALNKVVSRVEKAHPLVQDSHRDGHSGIEDAHIQR